MTKNRRPIIFFALAAFFGIAAAFAAKDLLQDRPVSAAAPVVQTTPVVVAVADVTAGAALADRQLDVVEWPSEYLPAGSFDDPAKLQDRVLRRPLATGEPVLAASLLPEGAEAGLASVIEKQLRAVSVKVDAVIGVAGFVNPGARVDVLATLRRIDAAKKLPYSRVILQDIPVLAIDQKMETARNGEPELVSVVTLQVDSKQAEKLIYSAHEGRLQLALRGPGDHEVVKTRSIGVADILGGPRRKASGAPRDTVQVLKGSTLTTNRF